MPARGSDELRDYRCSDADWSIASHVRGHVLAPTSSTVTHGSRGPSCLDYSCYNEDAYT